MSEQNSNNPENITNPLEDNLPEAVSESEAEAIEQSAEIKEPAPQTVGENAAESSKKDATNPSEEIVVGPLDKTEAENKNAEVKSKKEEKKEPKGKEKKPKKKKRFSVGLLIILIGVVCIVIGVGYEVINYPWGYSNDSVILKDPKPLPTEYSFYYGSSNTDDPTATVLPAQNSGLPLSRPKVDLELIGYIKIPRIGLSENIVEGSDNEILYGVGHVPGTAGAGQEGNFVLSGHRNYIYMHPFKYLNKTQVGDTVIIETGEMRYTYEIYDIFTVTPDETWVMQPQEGEEKMITLITCTPVPSYSERLICWGRLVSEEPLFEDIG